MALRREYTVRRAMPKGADECPTPRCRCDLSVGDLHARKISGTSVDLRSAFCLYSFCVSRPLYLVVNPTYCTLPAGGTKHYGSRWCPTQRSYQMRWRQFLQMGCMFGASIEDGYGSCLRTLRFGQPSRRIDILCQVPSRSTKLPHDQMEHQFWSTMVAGSEARGRKGTVPYFSILRREAGGAKMKIPWPCSLFFCMKAGVTAVCRR